MSLSTNYRPDDGKFFENFQNVNVKETGLWVRWLWPDYVEEEIIDRELKAMADAGFAGAEIGLHAMAKTWGTDAYWRGLIWAMRSAKKYGMKLDFFLTVGTLCLPLHALPADSDAAEKILYYYDTQVTVPAGSDGKSIPVTLGLPQKSSSCINARLVAVSYGAVEQEQDKIYRVSEGDSGVLYADALHLEAYPVDSPKQLWEFFGKKDEAALSKCGYDSKTHKFDLDVLTADSELLHVTADLPENRSGDDKTYVIFAYWEIPSDKTFGGTTQYCCDHYSLLGTRAVTDYYDRAVEKFPELGQLFKEVGRAFFGDSLENNGNWTLKILDKYYENFGGDFLRYLYSVARAPWNRRPEMGFPPAGDVAGVVKGAPVEAPPRPPHYGTPFALPDWSKGQVQYTSENIERFRNSYYQAMTQCFIEYNVKEYQRWADKYDMDLRCQSTYGQKQFMGQVSTYIDMAETESLAYRDEVDGYRAQAASVHMAIGGSGILSSEQGENLEDQFHTTIWSGDFLWRSNRFYVAGGNQLVYHVFAYSKYDTSITHGNGNMVWPGFRPQPNVGDNLQWNRPSLRYMQDYSKYIARTQLMLRTGQAKVDAAIYYHNVDNDRWDFDAFYHSDALEKAGYSYEFLDPYFFTMENAVVENGVFAPNGPGYRAILFRNQKTLPVYAAEKLLAYAKAGLAVIFTGTLPEKAAYCGDAHGDEKVKAAIGAMISLPNVMLVDDSDTWVDTLDTLGIAPSLKPGNASIMYAHRAAEDADYYFLYNQEKYFDHDKWWLPLQDIDEKVSLRSEKQGREPYLLNLWSGEISKLGNYTSDQGYISMDLKVKGNDTCAIVLADPAWNHGAAGEEQTAFVGDIPLGNWNLTLFSHEPGEKALSGEDLTHTVIVKKEIGAIGKAGAWNLMEGAENISGVGIYTTKIDWTAEEALCVKIDLGAVCDLYRLAVNGVEVPGANPVNPVQDITKYLKTGTNEICVEVASNFFHAEHSRNYLNCNYVERKAYTAWNFGILGQPALCVSRKLEN